MPIPCPWDTVAIHQSPTSYLWYQQQGRRYGQKCLVLTSWRSLDSLRVQLGNWDAVSRLRMMAWWRKKILLTSGCPVRFRNFPPFSCFIIDIQNFACWKWNFVGIGLVRSICDEGVSIRWHGARTTITHRRKVLSLYIRENRAQDDQQTYPRTLTRLNNVYQELDPMSLTAHPGYFSTIETGGSKF